MILTPEPAHDPVLSNQKSYTDALYEVFLRDLVHNPVRWSPTGTIVSLRKNPEVRGYHGVFWHIISGGKAPDAKRPIEMGRCQRLHWIRPLILDAQKDNCCHGISHWWIGPSQRGEGRRFTLSNENYEYIVIIEDRRTYALLVTAYFVEFPRRRLKFQREHDNYWSSRLT